MSTPTPEEFPKSPGPPPPNPIPEPETEGSVPTAPKSPGPNPDDLPEDGPDDVRTRS